MNLHQANARCQGDLICHKATLERPTCRRKKQPLEDFCLKSFQKFCSQKKMMVASLQAASLQTTPSKCWGFGRFGRFCKHRSTKKWPKTMSGFRTQNFENFFLSSGWLNQFCFLEVPKFCNTRLFHPSPGMILPNSSHGMVGGLRDDADKPSLGWWGRKFPPKKLPPLASPKNTCRFGF